MLSRRLIAWHREGYRAKALHFRSSNVIPKASLRRLAIPTYTRSFSQSVHRSTLNDTRSERKEESRNDADKTEVSVTPHHEHAHAVISTFDLFSIGSKFS